MRGLFQKLGLVLRVSLVLASTCAEAINILWTGGAGDGVWTNGNNWSGGAVPTSSQIAQFDNTSAGTKALTGLTNVGGIQFDDGAPTFNIVFLDNNSGSPYSIGSSSTATSIVNNSENRQNIFGYSPSTGTYSLNGIISGKVTISGIHHWTLDVNAPDPDVLFEATRIGGLLISSNLSPETYTIGARFSGQTAIRFCSFGSSNNTSYILTQPFSADQMAVLSCSVEVPGNGTAAITRLVNLANIVFNDTGTGNVNNGQVGTEGGNNLTIYNGPGTLQMTGPLTGSQGVSSIGGGIFQLTSSSNTYTGSTTISGGSTIEILSGGISHSSGVVFGAGGGTLGITDSGSSTYTHGITLTGNGAVTKSGSGVWTVGGPITGAGNLAVTGNMASTSASNTYTGATTISSNSSMAFSHPHSNGYTNGVTFGASSSTFDLSNMTPSASPFYTGGITAASGGIIKIAVDGAGNSTIMDLGGADTPNLDNILLTIVGTAPSGPATYKLFENVGVLNGDILVENVNLTSLPNTTFSFLGLDGTDVKFTLTGSPGIPNAQTAAGAANSVATTAQMSAQVISRGVLGVARDNDTGEPSYGSSAFASHPMKAPNLQADFLNATQGGLMNAAQDTTRKWSPARTDKAGIWFQPFGMVNRQGANGGSPGSKSRTAGLLAGFDYKSRYDVIWGAALGYARTTENFDSDAGKTGVKDKFATVFGTWFRGPWYVEGSLLLGLEKYQGTRNTGPTNNNIFVSKSHDGYQISPHVGGGYTFEVKGSKLKPYVTFDYTYASQYGYQEQGVGGMYLKQMDASMLRSEVGANISKHIEFDTFMWKPGFTLAVVNKKPLKKGTIVSSSGTRFESTTATTTNISPALESTIRFEDGYSFSAAWIGEFGSQYNMQEAFLKFTKKL